MVIALKGTVEAMGKTKVPKNWKELLEKGLEEGKNTSEIAKGLGITFTHLKRKLKANNLRIRRYLHEEA